MLRKEMQLSRKAEYALHALMYIASVNGHHHASINEIAESAKIPREYLAKVLKGLTNVGFLTSVRGVNGGYKLAKAKDKISFLDILEATQGPFVISRCPEKNRCPDFVFWDEITKNLKKTLGEMNLSKIDYDKFVRKGKKPALAQR
jgi:Rrf2 family protein